MKISDLYFLYLYYIYALIFSFVVCYNYWFDCLNQRLYA